MSERQYNKIIEKELQVLNITIDQKIVRGLSYHREAKRHKELLRKLQSLRSMKIPRAYAFNTFLF